MFKSARSRLRAAVFACAAALGLGAYAAPTATAVWRSNLGQSYTIGGNTYGVTIPGNETKQAGVLNADGTITVTNEWTGFSSPYIGLSSANPTAVSMLVKFSGLSIPESDATGVCLAAMRDSSGNEVGAVVNASSTSLKAYYMGSNATTTTEGDVTGGENVVVQSGYMLFSYSTTGGVKIYVGSDIASLAGGAMGSYKYGSNTIARFSIGGDPAGKVYTPSGMIIEEVALFVGSALTNTDVADYAFPTLDGETTALTMTDLNTKIAADSNVFFTASPVVTLDVEPSDATKTYLQSTAWNGTVFIKDADKTDIVPTAYGNPNSTLKLSGVKGYFAARQFNSSATPAIELEDSATEGRVYGLYLNNGYSFESQGSYYWTQTPELKGSGTLKADSSGAAVLVVVDKWDNFTGKLELTNKAVYFGTGIPERAKNVVTAGTIKLNGTVPASIGTWTVGTAFTGSVLTLTTAANATTTAFLTDSTKWKGTCQLNWNHTSALDIVNYGNANSVVEIVSDFSAYPTQNGGKAAADLAAELKLSANWTVADGWDSKTTTFAKLSGTGNLIVNGASGGSTAIPYTITKIENFTGALGGARGQFTIGTIVSSVEPVGGTKLVSLSNCTKTPVLTNTTVEYNGAAVEGITLEVKSDGIYVAEATVDVTVPVVDNTVVTVTVGDETVSPTTEGGNVYAVAPGSVVTVTYAAAEGYKISGTTVYTVDTANATTFKVAADMVTAQYVAQIKTGATTYEKYTTLAAALDSENIAYGITLLADVTESDITVDSNVNISGNISGNYAINANITVANGAQLKLMLVTLNGTLTIQNGGTYVTNGGALGEVVVQDGGIINLTTLSEDAAPLTVSTLTVNGALTVVSTYGDAVRGTTYKAISYATEAATIAEGSSFNGKDEWTASTVVDGDNTVVCLEITKVAVVDGVYYDTAQEAVEAAVASGKQAEFLVQPGTVTLGAGETLVVKGGYQPTVELDAGLAAPQYEVKSTYDLEALIYTYAVKSYVAQIGDTKYESVADAVAAATSGQTVKLLTDVANTTYTSVPSAKSLTLDLGGFTLSSPSYGFVVWGDLTITNGTVSATYSPVFISGGSVVVETDTTLVSSSSNAIAFNKDSSGGSLVVNGGSVTAREFCVQTGYSSNNTIVINGGTFTSIDNAVIGDNGTSGYSGNTFTINGGTFNGGITTAGYVACGVYIANDDTLVVNGGTFNITGGCGILARAGKVSVSGTTVINTTGTATGKVGDSRVVVPCAPIVYDSAANYPGYDETTTEFAVSGGTFTAGGQDVDCIVQVADEGDATSIAVSGGTFNTAVSETYCANGYEPKDYGNGMYGVRVDKGWIYEDADFPGYTGSWNKEISYDETTHKAAIEDGATYTANKPSAGQLVTINLSLSFDAANSDDDVHEGAKAAVRLGEGETEGTYVFQLYTTNETGTAAWLDATASGITPTVDQDYAFKFVLDMTNRTYKVTVGENVPLTIDSADTFGFADASASDTVQSIEFAGAGKVTSIKGSYEDIPVPEGFAEDDTFGDVTLTAAQAEWLNGQNNYAALVAKISTMSQTGLNDAYLLNLNVLDENYDGTYEFAVTAIDVGDTAVTVTVGLTRSGALDGGINGTLKLMGGNQLPASGFEEVDAVTFSDADFSEGGTTTCTFTKGEDAAAFYQPVIVAPAVPSGN